MVLRRWRVVFFANVRGLCLEACLCSLLCLLFTYYVRLVPSSQDEQDEQDEHNTQYTFRHDKAVQRRGRHLSKT